MSDAVGAVRAIASASVSSVMRARIAVAAIFFLNGVSVASWVVRIPDAQRALALSAGTLGLALLGAAGGALVAMPFAGRLVSRHGSRAVTVGAALAYAATLALPAVAPSLILLIAALFINGAANGSLNVAMNAQASTVERVHGRPIMASFHALFSGGGLAGAAGGGMIAAGGASAQLHLAAVGGVMIALVVLAARAMLPASAEWHPPEAEAGDEAVRPGRRVILLGVLAFSVLFAEGAMGDWSAVYLRDVAGAGPGLAASGYAAFSIAMALGRVVGDHLTARVGATRMVGFGAFLATAGIALALFDPSTRAIAIGFGAVGAGLATAFPSVLTAASRVPGMKAGAGIAAVATLGYTGLLAGPPLIGFVAQLTTLRGGMAAVGLACLLTAVLAGTLREDDGS
ncbi:MAG TPA: MFS transporter [Gemmatimonadaceae bacterium]|jgi:MFS family permease|nr:MFS transporter [Gemmatimonadota bacterium]MBP9107764.1 MFS transporter [Gemmatimonadaceae bacterium]HNV75993.1 MFS transporter [Gemmatimonadaceae bacterium]HPV74667.1 MFS transporter [Gemmatimonadaceae bacterium]